MITPATVQQKGRSMATITDQPRIPTQAEVDALMSAAVRSLARDGITPQHVLSWDVTGKDRAVKALAGALGNFLALSAVPESPEWWEMVGARALSGNWPEGSMPS